MCSYKIEKRGPLSHYPHLFIWHDGGSGLFLDIAISEFKKGAQPLEREVAGGEVHGDEPSGNEVDEVVQEVGVGDAVDGGVEGEGEEEGGG